MAKRETFKDVELSERQWRIGRFDALTGSFIAYKLMNLLLPMAGNLPGDIASDEGVTGFLSKGLPTMSREDFTSLQTDCLRLCSEITMAGNVQTPIPVMLANGAWGVDDIADNPMLAMGLTIHALVFNVSGFFGEGALKGLSEKITGMSSSNAQTSTTSPTPQS